MSCSVPRRWFSVVLATMGVALVSTSVVAAPIPPLTVNARDRCVQGPWVDGTEVRFTLKTAAGTVKDQVTKTAEDGRATGCFDDPIKIDDRISVKVGGTTRTITVLKLSLDIDRVKDRVTGKGPAGRTVRVVISRCPMDVVIGPDCPSAVVRHRSVSAGDYTLDTTGELDLRGHDHVQVSVRNSTDDRFQAESAVPFFALGLGTPFVGGSMLPGDPRGFVLRDVPGGSIIATASLSIGGEDLAGSFGGGTFTDGVDPVNVEPGNHVTGAFASDAKMKVPTMIHKLDPDEDLVSATCFANRPYLLTVFSGPGRDGGLYAGVAGSGGSIVVDTTDHPTGPDVDLVVGHAVRLFCMTSKGDAIDVDATVP